MNKEGLIKCSYLPPKRLYHPVLPFRSNNKLLFCLCRTCAVECNFSGECVHESKAQRSLTSIWVPEEVRLAIRNGYQVLDIMVYEYEVTKYDPHTSEVGLFSDHINTFLKLKAEANGYPSWVRNHEDEECYIDTFNAREGVLMDRNAIRPNATKRGLGNLRLNSLWGKLAEWRNRTQTKVISDRQEMYRFLANPGVDVVNLMSASDSVVCASWRYTAEEQAPSLRHTNKVVAAYVACGGGMHLYTHLDILGEPALYCDSVIIVQKTDEPPLIKCGDALVDDFITKGE